VLFGGASLRAVCGKTASTVRWGGTGESCPLPYLFINFFKLKHYAETYLIPFGFFVCLKQHARIIIFFRKIFGSVNAGCRFEIK